MVSVATGALSPLLRKLAGLLEEEYSNLKGVRDEIVFLKDELSSMNALLLKLADMNDLDVQVKEWKNQVRELAYDIEDCIDDFMLHVEHGSDIKKGFFQKSIHKLKTLRSGHGIAQQIRKLKVRVDNASDRRKRYNYDDATSSSSGVVPIDPRLPALYADAKGLVGMDGPKEELIKLLTQGEGESVQKLRVVSIVGFGGLGKTTLAKQVYDEHFDLFECRAFVSVSQKPDIIRLLSDILLQVKRPHSTEPHSNHAWEVHHFIDELRNYMQNKRYFIVIDDLWDVLAWDAIRCAFPENNYGSRVITTTRIETLAASCSTYEHGYVYKMKSLNEEDAKRLFFSRIFGSEDTCPLQFKKISVEILKKCGGLPLAIICIASLLASHPIRQMEQWEYVRNYLGTRFEKNPTLEGMRQILNLSYINLPHYLKTCFLYLGTYPEDYPIQKVDLARRWVAEGFVSNVYGQDAEDVADSYFNELVNRSVIQPIYHYFLHRVSSCKVHDMILDLIVSKCQEENFVTILGSAQDMIGLRSKVRRLSLQFDEAKHGTLPATINQSQARSLTIIGGSDCSHMLPLLEFRLLRVLDLDFRSYAKTALDLTGMCLLFQLRYFKIQLHSAKTSLQLPTQIQGLQYLETFEIDILNIYLNSDTVIPTDIVHLPGLLHLIIPSCIRLPDGIGNMKSLRTLGEFDLAVNTLENIKGLGELTNLRSLHIISSSDDATKYGDLRDVLSTSLGKIICCNLRDLQVMALRTMLFCDGLVCLSPSRSNLQALDLSGWSFSRFPKWIGEIHNLNTLSLNVMELLKDDVRILAELPALIALQLSVRWAPKEGIIIYGTAFPVLKYFALLYRTACLSFEAGAIPNLQRLYLGVRELLKDDVRILAELPALITLQLYVRWAPKEGIIIYGTAFPVLKYFALICRTASLSFKARAIPNLQRLQLSFRAREVEQCTPLLVGIEHLSGLPEIDLEIRSFRGEESEMKAAEFALRNANNMHTSCPDVKIRLEPGLRYGFVDEEEDKEGNTSLYVAVRRERI